MGKAIRPILRSIGADPGFIYPVAQSLAYLSQSILNPAAGLPLTAAAILSSLIAAGLKTFQHLGSGRQSELARALRGDTVTYKANGYWQWAVIMPLGLVSGSWNVAGMAVGFGTVMTLKGCLELNNEQQTHRWDYPERLLKGAKQTLERLGCHHNRTIGHAARAANRLFLRSEFWSGVGAAFFAGAAGLPWEITLPPVAACMALSIAHNPSDLTPAYRRCIRAAFNAVSRASGMDATGPARKLHRTLCRAIERKRKVGHVSDMTLARGIALVFGISGLAAAGAMLAASSGPVAAVSALLICTGQSIAIWGGFCVLRHMGAQDQKNYEAALTARAASGGGAGQNGLSPTPERKPASFSAPGLRQSFHGTVEPGLEETEQEQDSPNVPPAGPSCQSGPK